MYREQDARGTSSATAPRLANVGYLAQDPRYYDCVSTILFSRVCSLARRSRWHRAGVHLRTKPARELRGRIARDLPAAQPWHRGGVGSSRTATPVIRCAGQRRDPQLAVCCGRTLAIRTRAALITLRVAGRVKTASESERLDCGESKRPGPHHELNTALRSELAEQVVDVRLDRGHRDDQPAGNLLVRITPGDQP